MTTTQHPEWKTTQPFKAAFEADRKGLDEANAKGWAVVDMKKDWRMIFLFSAAKQEKAR